MSLVDVILPTYNNGKWLQESVSSILNQTFPDFKLIIVDDQSTDGSVDKLPTDKRIQVFKNPRKGLVSALNLALEKSTSKWIIRCDGDDLNDKERFDKQLKYAEKNNLDWVSCQVKVFNTPKDSIGYPEYVKWHNSLITKDQITRARFIECPLIHPTWLIKREVYKNNNFYQKGDFPEDYDFFLRSFHNLKIAKIPQILLHWRDWPGRTSRISQAYKLKKFLKVKTNYFKKPVIHPLIILGTGLTGKKIAKELINKGYAVKYFVDIDPKKIGIKIYNVPVKSVKYFQNDMHFEQNRKNDIDFPFIINSIMTRGSRNEISKMLLSLNLKEETDFLHFQ